MPGTYELIQSYTLPSSQANYTFTGISQSNTTNGAGLVHINNYSGTNGFKTILSHGVNGAVGLVQLQQSTWRNTSAINQIRVFPEQGGSLNTGYKLTLYGILKA